MLVVQPALAKIYFWNDYKIGILVLLAKHLEILLLKQCQNSGFVTIATSILQKQTFLNTKLAARHLFLKKWLALQDFW